MMIDRLHYISQRPENGTHLTAIEATLKTGAKWIQLRVKNQPAATVLQYAKQARSYCQAYGAKLIVNDYPEIALEVGAHGLHLGLDDMPIQEARRIVGQNMIIGGTANTFDQLKRRVADGVDYIGLGPYRFTKTKEKLSPVLGLDGYTRIMIEVDKVGIKTPIIAIGGIEPQDIKALLKIGLHGVAVSGAITYATNAAATVAQMYAQLNNTP